MATDDSPLPSEAGTIRPADAAHEKPNIDSNPEPQTQKDKIDDDEKSEAMISIDSGMDGSPRNPHNNTGASLWCLIKGRSHANLFKWGVFVCPACNQDLRQPEKACGRSCDRSCDQRHRGRGGRGHVSDASRDSSADSWTSSSRSRSRSVDTRPRPPPPPPPRPLQIIGPPPPPPPHHSVQESQFGTDPDITIWERSGPGSQVALDVRYQVQFLYESGNEIGIRPWHELLNLENERRSLADNSSSIIEIITVVQTNIKSHFLSQDRDSRKIMREGILRNPKYTVEVKTNDMIIYSQQIIDYLKEVVTYYPSVRLTGDAIALQEPYCIIFHHMKEIQARQRSAINAEAGKASLGAPYDEETRRHLGVLQDALPAHIKTAVDQETARYSTPNPTATFKMLWLLFKPGTSVYTQMDGGLQACVVKSVSFNNYSVSKLSASYTLQMWYMNFDGQRLGRCECDRIIAPFEGEREITSLNVFPCEYLDSKDGGLTRKELEERGEKFYRYLRCAQVHYSGKSLGFESNWYNSRAIIDITSYYHYGRGPGSRYNGTYFVQPEVGNVDDTSNISEEGSRHDNRFRQVHGPPRGQSRRPPQPPPPPPPGRPPPGQPLHYPPSYGDEEEDHTGTYDIKFPWREYENINPKEMDSLEIVDPTTSTKNRHRYLLCPKKVIGFVLKSRNWDQLDIECCSDPIPNRAAIDTLVMPEERKTMIKALVYRYTDPGRSNSKISAPWAADFIENKGDGQIFLLHGSPGVGKTYTAECIAESTGRPLLSLTCGDIGNSEEVLERRLSIWFRLAELWGAVMLLDEADVFLERRAISDLRRNSLVSVFLRTMEYYRGILFLTTNRVGHFDDAFISRIHVVIHYDSFTDSDRECVWTQFFNKLKRERGKDIEIPNRVKNYVLKDPEMVQIRWNGREIRNAFQTAVALAEYRFAMLEEKEADAKACLEREDFEKVCEMTGAFQKYLNSVSGLDESQRARSDQARNDAFTAES